MELLTFVVIGLVTGLIVTKGLGYTSHGVAVDTIIGAFGASASPTVFGLLGLTTTAIPFGVLVIPIVGALVLPTVLHYLPVK